MAKFTCIECGDKYDPDVNGDAEERLCHHCLMNEDEYSVTVIASFGVMAKSQEDADNYMIDQLINMGFDGIKFDDVADDEIVYQIFNTRKLDKAKK